MAKKAQKGRRGLPSTKTRPRKGKKGERAASNANQDIDDVLALN